MGSFGRVEIAVPRARLTTPDGKTIEWKSKALRAYQRRTLAADALIASSYLAGIAIDWGLPVRTFAVGIGVVMLLPAAGWAWALRKTGDGRKDDV